MNIYELREEIKSLRDRLNAREVYTALLILVVGFGSFGLGRLSNLDEGKSPIRIEQTLPTQTASVASVPPLLRGEDKGGVFSSVKDEGLKIKDNGTLAPAGQLVASKSGEKYHFPWCSGAQRISEANKIWFDSVEEARKAGYTPASNCKGLK